MESFKKSLTRLLDYIASAASGLLLAASLVGLGGEIHWVLDLFNHFRVQYSILLLLVFCFVVLRKKWVLSGVAGVTLLLNGLMVLNLYLPLHHQDTGENPVRLFYANVHRVNEEHAAVRQMIVDEDPSVVFLIELDQGWLDDLDMDSLGYHFQLVKPQNNNFGYGFFSKYPIESVSTVPVSTPAFDVDIQIDDKVLTIVGVHPPPPRTGYSSEMRDEQLLWFGEYLSQKEGPTIFIGDLNISSWSPVFRKLLYESGFNDSRQGFGVQATWPTYMRFFLIPIDHILVNEHVNVVDREVGDFMGSDHLPVLVEFFIQNE